MQEKKKAPPKFLKVAFIDAVDWDGSCSNVLTCKEADIELQNGFFEFRKGAKVVVVPMQNVSFYIPNAVE